MKDKSFDGIAAKFDKNIYGTTKGKLRHEMLQFHLLPYLKPSSKRGMALDAGGGTGEFSRVLVELGYDVVLNDISEDTLKLAKQKLPISAPVVFHHGEITDIPSDNLFDLITCHAVLEWLANPEESIKRLIELAAPNATISLSFFNADANIFGNLVYGNFTLVENNMQQKNRVQLATHKPLKPRAVLDILQSHPVDVVHTAGIRCFHDYLREKSQQTNDFAQLLAAEKRFSGDEPYKWLGKYFQIIMKKQDLY